MTKINPSDLLCRACRESVRRDATRCPHCGETQEPRRFWRAFWGALMVISGLTLLIAIFVVGDLLAIAFWLVILMVTNGKFQKHHEASKPIGEPATGKVKD